MDKQDLVIKVKYMDEHAERIIFVGGAVSNWIDLRAAKDVHINKGGFALIPLGVAMKLPEGYEAHLAPRSSTFIKWHIIQTNSVGVIDNSYSGDDDEWKMPVYATEDTFIKKGDRVCQFRIVPTMSSLGEISIESVEHLDDVSRGGFGSTGTA